MAMVGCRGWEREMSVFQDCVYEWQHQPTKTVSSTGRSSLKGRSLQRWEACVSGLLKINQVCVGGNLRLTSLKKRWSIRGAKNQQSILGEHQHKRSLRCEFVFISGGKGVQAGICQGVWEFVLFWLTLIYALYVSPTESFIKIESLSYLYL